MLSAHHHAPFESALQGTKKRADWFTRLFGILFRKRIISTIPYDDACENHGYANPGRHGDRLAEDEVRGEHGDDELGRGQDAGEADAGMRDADGEQQRRQGHAEHAEHEAVGQDLQECLPIEQEGRRQHEERQQGAAARHDGGLADGWHAAPDRAVQEQRNGIARRGEQAVENALRICRKRRACEHTAREH